MFVEETPGRKAENKAADYLRSVGYKLIAKNWKTPQCEIDIIAKKQNIVVCFEVKYRKSNAYGAGFDYITATKLRQMTYAAEQWRAVSSYEGAIELGAIEVTGNEFYVSDIIEALTIS